jgi:probable HAF family extracellular repeat protein
MNPLQVSSFLAALALSAASLAAQPPTYRITVIEGPPPPIAAPGVFAADLNNRNEIVGSFNDPQGFPHAFLWQDGDVIDLGHLGSGQFANASAINDRTEVVGTSLGDDPSGFRAFLWKEGEISDIGPGPELDVQFMLPTAIDNKGRVVGEMDIDVREFPFLRRRDGTYVELPALPGAPQDPDQSDTLFVNVVAMNNHRLRVGTSDSPDGDRAVLWTGRAITNLGVLPGDLTSSANDVNDHGQVVGTSGAAALRPFVWKDGVMTELPKFAPAASFHGAALSINDRGTIVGTMTGVGGNPPPTPVLWQNGTLHDVNTLVDATDPLKPYVTVRIPKRINNRSSILATAVDSRTGGSAQVLLTVVR